jgi:uncharacterized protein (DUF2141 family)
MNERRRRGFALMTGFTLAAVLGVCLGFLATPGFAQTCAGEPSGTKLNVIIEGVRSDQGLMTVTLYPPDNGKFLRSKGEIAVLRIPSQAPSTNACLWLPGPGPYAVAVYDDLNENHRFDHTLVAPLEPYGFSNNPRLFLGPPSAGAARIEVSEAETTIHIQLRYPSGEGGDQAKTAGH